MKITFLIWTLLAGVALGESAIEWSAAEAAGRLQLVPPTNLHPGEGVETSIYDWDERDPSSSTAQPFHTGSWLEAKSSGEGLRGASRWSVAEVLEESEENAPLLRIFRGSTAATQHHGAFFLAFLKKDFLHGYANDALTLNEGSLFSSGISGLQCGEVRYVIAAGGRWFVSETAWNQATRIDFGGAELLNARWGQWEPVAGRGGRLGSLPSAFPFATSSIANLEGVGLLVIFDAPQPGNSLRFELSDFRVKVARKASPNDSRSITTSP